MINTEELNKPAMGLSLIPNTQVVEPLEEMSCSNKFQINLHFITWARVIRHIIIVLDIFDIDLILVKYLPHRF